MGQRMGQLERLIAITMVAATVVAWGPLLSTSAGASPPALQACTANNIKVSVAQLGDVRGQKLEAFKLQNTGSSTCGLYGYPSLTFFTESRLDAHVKVAHTASAYAAVTPKLLTIGPDEVVSFGISYRESSPGTVAVTKRCLVETILIQLPLAPVSSGDFAYHQRLDACGARSVVAVTPVEGRALPQRQTG